MAVAFTQTGGGYHGTPIAPISRARAYIPKAPYQPKPSYQLPGLANDVHRVPLPGPPGFPQPPRLFGPSGFPAGLRTPTLGTPGPIASPFHPAPYASVPGVPRAQPQPFLAGGRPPPQAFHLPPVPTGVPTLPKFNMPVPAMGPFGPTVGMPIPGGFR